MNIYRIRFYDRDIANFVIEANDIPDAAHKVAIRMYGAGNSRQNSSVRDDAAVGAARQDGDSMGAGHFLPVAGNGVIGRLFHVSLFHVSETAERTATPRYAVPVINLSVDGESGTRYQLLWAPDTGSMYIGVRRADDDEWFQTACTRADGSPRRFSDVKDARAWAHSFLIGGGLSELEPTPGQEVLSFKVEDGALIEAPVYVPHRKAKNWLAIIHPDPQSPGGIGRKFAKPAGGRYKYMIDQLAPGQPIEFGADKGSHTRWYGMVVSVTEEVVLIRRAGFDPEIKGAHGTSERTAYKMAQEWAAAAAAQPERQYVELKLTPLEAEALATGTNETAEGLQSDPMSYTHWSGHRVSAFWRALDKLQAARSKVSQAYVAEPADDGNGYQIRDTRSGEIVREGLEHEKWAKSLASDLSAIVWQGPPQR